MAITLMTGLPGACKTLYSLSFVKNWSEADSRPVFYSGIKDCTIPDWQEIDAEKWFECPPNSIVIIDECQRVFRPRAASKEPPKFVSELETHRHSGIDLWLITQHPSLCDIAVRRLTQRHFHSHRIFGMERSTIHEWQGAQVDCEKESAKKKSIKKIWAFDKKAYAYYKSAETHTVKRSIPKQVIILAVLPLIFIGLGYIAYNRLKAKPLEQQQGVTAASLSQGAMVGRAGVVPFDPIADAKNYVNLHNARYQGLPHTAPIYDEIRKPSEAPMPVACIQSSVRCTCYTQQATVMAVPRDTCIQIVQSGYFDDSPKKDQSAIPNQLSDASQKASVPQMSFQPAGAVPVSLVADASKSSNAADGYGLLGKVGKGVKKREYD